MKPLNALDSSRRFLPSERDVLAVLLMPSASTKRLKAWRMNRIGLSREAVDTSLTVFVWLVTILVLPAGVELAKLLAS